MKVQGDNNFLNKKSKGNKRPSEQIIYRNDLLGTHESTVLCKSNANDNRRISRFVLVIYRRYIRETSHGLANVKTINQRDIGTIFVISRRDTVLARLRYNDISQSKTINRHNILLQRSSL